MDPSHRACGVSGRAIGTPRMKNDVFSGFYSPLGSSECGKTRQNRRNGIYTIYTAAAYLYRISFKAKWKKNNINCQNIYALYLTVSNNALFSLTVSKMFKIFPFFFFRRNSPGLVLYDSIQLVIYYYACQPWLPSKLPVVSHTTGGV